MAPQNRPNIKLQCTECTTNNIYIYIIYIIDIKTKKNVLRTMGFTLRTT